MKKISTVIITCVLSFVLLFCGIFATVKAEENADVKGGGAAVSRQLPGGGYTAKLYDATNGLLTSEANAILATKDGFIWIGSYSGLIRYDGTNFERQDSSTGITSGNTLFEDSKNRLWVGTNDNGIVMVDKGKSIQFRHTEGLLSSAIRAIAEDSEGTIFVGTTHGIAYIDENMQLTMMKDPQIVDEYIQQMTSDLSGRIYGTTRTGNAFSIENRRVNAYYSGRDMGIGDIRSIYADEDNPGFVYLGTDAEYLYYGSFDEKLAGLKKVSVAPLNGVNSIRKAAGRIWAVSDSQVGYLDPDSGFTVLSNLPMNNAMGSMIEDNEGNLWFTSSRQGIMKIVSNHFIDLFEMAGLEDAVVNTTCLKDGLLYIGTDTGLRIMDERYNLVKNELTELLKEDRIRSIIKDRDGSLWICTYTGGHGLVCYDKKKHIACYTERNGLISDKTRCATLMSDGSLLVGTNDGFNILKNGKITASYGVVNGISNPAVLTLEEGDDGKIYVGSDGDGIYIVDGNKVSLLGLDDGLTSQVILRIKKDHKRGVYWIITSNSLAYMKDEKITTLEHFPYSNNYDLYFDKNGNAWILASNGIYVANADKLLENGEVEYLFYDTAGGLPSVATGNSFSELGLDGTLYISCRNGVSAVNIDQYFEGDADIRLTIPYVDADENRIYIDDSMQLTIPASTKVLTLYGYALTYSMQNPTIQYKLEGFDSVSTVVKKQNMEPIRYTNLDGGKYRFLLSVINTSTGEVQKTITLNITKELAFYEQHWFWLILNVAILFTLNTLMKRHIAKQTEALEKKNEEHREFMNQIIFAFAKCVDARDEYTNGHSYRVAKYTRMLAEKLGESSENIEKYYNIALLHDIGKISIPDHILNKDEKLNDEEYEIMKSHAQKGYSILKDVKIQEDLAEGARNHHERYDGKGYPQGLKGDEIPWVARIISVADTFDAMYSTRPYREKLPLEYVASEIEKGAGTQHDPLVVEKFMELVREGAFDNE